MCTKMLRTSDKIYYLEREEGRKSPKRFFILDSLVVYFILFNSRPKEVEGR